MSRGGRGRTRAAVRGRSIGGTKVKALPEWLGRCKLLETLCVRARPPPCAFRLRCAAAACAAAAGRWAGTARRLDAAAAVLPAVGRSRRAGLRPAARPARSRGGANAAPAAAALV